MRSGGEIGAAVERPHRERRERSERKEREDRGTERETQRERVRKRDNVNRRVFTDVMKEVVQQSRVVNAAARTQ